MKFAERLGRTSSLEDDPPAKAAGTCEGAGEVLAYSGDSHLDHDNSRKKQSVDLDDPKSQAWALELSQPTMFRGP